MDLFFNYFNFVTILGVLDKYSPKDSKYIEAKNKLLNNTTNFFRGREKIIEGFKNGIFPLNYDDVIEEQARYKEEEKNIRNKNGLIDYKKLERLIDFKKRDISDELVRMHFLVQDLGVLLKKTKKLKNNPDKNRIQVNLINSGLKDLKKEIEDKSEKEIENPNKIVDVIENILEFNRQQQGQGLKILTPNQMLSRLPNTLAQLKAGNNSENLKMKLGKYCILCTDQKNLQNKSMKV